METVECSFSILGLGFPRPRKTAASFSYKALLGTQHTWYNKNQWLRVTEI